MRPNDGTFRTKAGRRLGSPARLGWLLVVLAATALAGCVDPLDRRDTVALYAGNAIAGNKAAQTIDPWPAASRATDWATSGRRVRIAIERYNSNASIPPSGLTTSSVAPASSGSSSAAPPAPPGN